MILYGVRPFSAVYAPCRFQNGQARSYPAATSATETHPDLQTVRDRWDKNSHNWIQAIRSGVDLFRRDFLDKAFFRFLGPVNGLNLLDAGCGEGSLCRQMASMGAKVTGLDLSSKLIRAARTHQDNVRLPVRFQVGSFTDLKRIKSKSLDRVISNMALMDSPDLLGALKAFHRVLRPNGELIFSIKHPFITLKGLQYQLEPATGRMNMSFTGSYFDKQPFEKTVDFDAGNNAAAPIKTIHYPKTMSDYINSLREAGFSDIFLEEPRPSDDVCKTNPKMRRYQHVPCLLMVRAKKAKVPRDK